MRVVGSASHSMTTELKLLSNRLNRLLYKNSRVMFVRAGPHCCDRQTMTDDGAFGVMMVVWSAIITESAQPKSNPVVKTEAETKDAKNFLVSKAVPLSFKVLYIQ